MPNGIRDGANHVLESSSRSDAERPSIRIAIRLAEETGKAVDELTPLAHSVDPEALDAVFADRDVNGAQVTFTHDGYAISVTGERSVHVAPVDEE